MLCFCLIGVELLKQFKEEFVKFEKERQELTNAEKLFDLPLTMYPDMLQIEKELRGSEQIYSIYEKQKVSRNSYETCIFSKRIDGKH